MIFSIAMGADYSFELISIETYAPQFIGHNKFFLGSVFASHKIFHDYATMLPNNFECHGQDETSAAHLYVQVIK